MAIWISYVCNRVNLLTSPFIVIYALPMYSYISIKLALYLHLLGPFIFVQTYVSNLTSCLSPMYCDMYYIRNTYLTNLSSYQVHYKEILWH